MVRDSAEERFVVGRIRAALGNGLDLGDNVAFLHQEWRLSSSDKVDLLGVDRRTGQLVVVEAKRSEAAALRERDARGRTAAEQAASYVAQLTTHAAEWAPLFQRLATALARIYGRAAPGREGEGRRLDVTLVPRWEVWWPGGSMKQPSAAIEGSG